MKSVALVTLDYPPERGGVARYLGNLVHASNGAIDVFVNETHVSNGPGTVHQAKLIAEGRWAWRPMVGFCRSLKSKGYRHILVSHVLPVGTAAWLARLQGGLPYSVMVHGLDLQMAAIQRRKRWLARQVLEAARVVIANSAFTADLVKKIAPHARVQILTPGIEPHTFPTREEARKLLGITPHTFQLLVVTRLVPRKGIDLVIEALAALPADTRLAVVGDGLDRARLEQLAATMGVADRVQFIPDASDANRDRWYAAADVFTMPVREEGRDVEGFGIVFLEAAAAGLPVVGGKAGGAPEAVVDGETGILVDGTDARAVAAVILRLHGDAALRARLGEAGRRRVHEAFTWEERWLKIHDRLI